MDSRSERAYAVLVACAIGDAAGLPTRGMSPDEIESTYGPPPTWWDRDVVHPTKPGVPEGTVTEVTHEILLAASTLLGDEAGATTRDHAGAVPMGWRQLVRAIPIGIATSTADPEGFAQAVWEACGGECLTRQEFQAAALLAAGVSLQVDGTQERLSTRDNRLWEALHLVESLKQRGTWSPEPDVVAATRRAMNIAMQVATTPTQILTEQFGSSPEPTRMVPLCFGLSTYLAHWLSRYGITRIGGDTSLMSAIVGALCGEAKGHHDLRRGSWMHVEEVNDLDLTSLAKRLVARRPAPADDAAGDDGASDEGATPAWESPNAPSPFEDPDSTLTTRRTLFTQVSPPTPLGPARGGAPVGRVAYMGQLVLNQSLHVSSFPEPGGDVWAIDKGMELVGGIEVLRAARRMGLEAVSLGPIGEGPHASLIEECLRREGIVNAGPRVPGTDNGYRVTITDDAGQRLVVRAMIDKCAVPTHAWAEFTQTMGPADVLYYDGEFAGAYAYDYGDLGNDDAAREALLRLPEHVRLVLDTSYRGEMPSGIPFDNTIFVIGQDEVAGIGTRMTCDRTAFDGSRTFRGAAFEATRLFDCHALVPSGPEGAHFSRPNYGGEDLSWPTVTHCPAPPFGAEDPLEARHVFSGVFAASLARGLPIERAIQLAVCARALATATPGRATCPTREEIEAAADALEASTGEE